MRTRPPASTWITWVVVTAALGLTFIAYLRPALWADVGNLIWSCLGL